HHSLPAGRGEPMLHTRLRPHCKDFLEKIAKLYELHVFTFGSRLYAHTIADEERKEAPLQLSCGLRVGRCAGVVRGFLGPREEAFFSSNIIQGECIDPFSKRKP
ncbi:hypothetical protein H8958_021095, partial [Nasalis larvatus]